ncbi:MAG: ABC transporter permease [Anaerovoracaceae bacterium]|jgi:peptide/nickel transport system permease protein
MIAGIALSASKQIEENKSWVSMIWSRFKKNKLAMLGLCIFLAMVIMAIIVSLFGDYEAAIEMDIPNKLLKPSREHLFGTDQFGRDILLRMMFGARISLSIGILTMVVSLIVGSLIGAVAGYYGNRIDNVLMRIMDVFLAIPSTLLAISIVAALGQSMTNLLVAIAVSQVPAFARVVRSSILSVKGQDYIEAARAYGTHDSRIILRHIIPNALGPIIVQATLNVARSILHISSLSYVGLGISPPTPEWGSMLSEGQTLMRYHPHLILIPGIAIVLAVMSLNLVGDGLRDALDPRLKN